jgi:hypothetical protein
VDDHAPGANRQRDLPTGGPSKQPLYGKESFMMAPIEGATALLRKGGVYRVCKVYQMNGALFAQHSGGYVRIYETGATSVDNLAVSVLHIDEPLVRDKWGRLRVDNQGTPTAIPNLSESNDI